MEREEKTEPRPAAMHEKQAEIFGHGFYNLFLSQ
jgi:hypothetical protein